MEIISGVAVPVVEKILTPAYTAIRYFICVRREVEDMRRLFDRLNALRNDINPPLQRRGRDGLEAVNIWMIEVEATQTTVEAIETDFALPARCLGFCPDCCFRFQISRRIRHCKRNIEELTSRHGDFNGVYEGAPTQMLHPPSAAEKNIVGESVEENKRLLKQWLTEDDEDVRIVGIWGMGGVGKTVLLTLIHNDDEVRKFFDIIFWVTVSREVNIPAIQMSIAKALGLEVQGNSTVEDSKTALYNNLLRKKFLLILDDVWETIDLREEVGVPYEESKCKVVFSTRSAQITRNMRATHSIQLRPLREEEGWELFCKKAFSHKSVPSKIQGIAREIAAECNGLLLAINAVARAVPTSEDVREWRDCLQAIKDVDSTFYQIHSDMESRLIQPLKWSYNVLPITIGTPDNVVIR